ncbi:MAG TPA: hypothetical protein VLL75_07065 [Vicinamibacteria bacterium]|nr:hypothetical protein [Vicinamibacteria bacterium]
MRYLAAYESVSNVYGVETVRARPTARGLAIPFLPSFGVRFLF